MFNAVSLFSLFPLLDLPSPCKHVEAEELAPAFAAVAVPCTVFVVLGREAVPIAAAAARRGLDDDGERQRSFDDDTRSCCGGCHNNRRLRGVLCRRREPPWRRRRQGKHCESRTRESPSWRAAAARNATGCSPRRSRRRFRRRRSLPTSLSDELLLVDQDRHILSELLSAIER